jgi:hypothetical protein
MSITEFSYVTNDNLETTHKEILEILTSKKYKINQDIITEITAHHPLSAMNYPHDVKVQLIENEQNVKITFKIDHRASSVYMDRISKEVICKLTPIKAKVEIPKQEVINNLTPIKSESEIQKQEIKNNGDVESEISVMHSKLLDQLTIFKNIFPKQLQKELEKTMKNNDSKEFYIFVNEKINPVIQNYTKQIINHDFNPDEESLWVHEVTRGVFNKEVIEKWIVTNLRAMIYLPVTKENPQAKISAIGLKISDSVVMNQQRRSSGSRVGTFVGSGGRGFVGASVGSSQSKSSTYGDLVFLFNGKEAFRFSGVSDPHGVRRLIETIKKQGM